MGRSLVLSSFLWLWNFPSPVKGKYDAMVNSHGFIRTNNSLFTTALERSEEIIVNPELADVCGQETMIVLWGV